MRSPRITVLMTLYNGGEYLKQSVKSVLGQTHNDFEFLIIDDGSTDGSPAIVKSFHDDRIKIHQNDHNMGQTKSLNVGLRLASGDYIARIDADDVAFPPWLERHVAFLKENSRCGVVSAHVVTIDETNAIGRMYPSSISFEDVVLRSFIRSPINHGGSLMNKKIVLDNGGYDEKYKTAADYDLWVRLIKKNIPITGLDEVLMAIREHGSSLSRSEEGRVFNADIAEIMEKAINHFADAPINSKEVSLIYRLFYNEGRLTGEEFNQAIHSLEWVYNHAGRCMFLKRKNIHQWRNQFRTTACLKRIYFYITRGDYKEARAAVRSGMRYCGALSVFSLFYALSLFGRPALRFIPGFYDMFRNGRARMRLPRPLNLRLS